MQLGMTPKELHFADDARSRLINGVEKMASAVKSTLGPMGNTVLIESNDTTHGILVTKDGVTVAKSIFLLDPVENLAVRMMKEAADKTATSAGDGTTTAIVLTEALVKAGTSMIKEGINRTEVLRHLSSITDEIIDQLREWSKEVTGDTLRDVAVISANNDSRIGDIIADVFESVGENGIVTVERSDTHETYFKTTEGVKIDRGYSSPLFINDHKRDECVYEDVHVLVSDIEISNILQIENVLKPIISGGKKLLIIAPCSQNVINTLSANVMKNNLKIVSIIPPDFGYRQNELMQDIALSVGATYFSEKTGDDLSLIEPSDLGHCHKIVVGRTQTVIMHDSRDVSEAVSERITQLKDAYNLATKKQDKDFILTRIASLSGRIGVVYVGGNTDLEQKELYDRVDDAVCAVRSALEEGIISGGGWPLMNISAIMYSNALDKDISIEKKVAYEILTRALMSPLKQILQNAGADHDGIMKHWDEKTTIYGGYDVRNKKFGNMIEMGIIDPFKVTRTALLNAVSVAITILSTNAIITMARAYETQ